MCDPDVLETLFSEARLRLPRPRGASAPRGVPAAPRPEVAGTLSLLWMGAGHVYAGRRGLGLGLMGLTGLAILLHGALAAVWPGVQATLAALGWPSLALAALAAVDLLLLVVWVASAVDASREAERRGGRRGDLPGLVLGTASLLLPGWGELMGGRLRAAAAHLPWGAVQGGALGMLLLSPLIVPAAGGPVSQRIHELALLVVVVAAVSLVPLRLALAFRVACADAPVRPRLSTRRTRLLVYLLALAGLLAVQSFPAGFYRDVARDLSEEARAVGLRLIPDAVEEWTL